MNNYSISRQIILLTYIYLGDYILGYLIWQNKWETILIPKIKEIINSDIVIRKLDEKEIESLIKTNKKNIEIDSIENLKKLLKGQEINEKIKWIGTSGKGVITYTQLFVLLHQVIENGENKLNGKRRSNLMHFIINNFVKFHDKQSIEIPQKSLDSAYTNFAIGSIPKNNSVITQ